MSVPPAYANLVQLTRRLSLATTRGEAEWVIVHPNPIPLARGRTVPDPDEISAFRYDRPTGQVLIASRDGDGVPPFELQLMRDGQVIDRLTSEWWDEAGETPAPWNQALADLYRAARGKALGIDETINSLLGELPLPDDDIPF